MGRRADSFATVRDETVENNSTKTKLSVTCQNISEEEIIYDFSNSETVTFVTNSEIQISESTTINISL